MFPGEKGRWQFDRVDESGWRRIKWMKGDECKWIRMKVDECKEVYNKLYIIVQTCFFVVNAKSCLVVVYILKGVIVV